jgi:D-Tyr-tRNAtyr deacylase
MDSNERIKAFTYKITGDPEEADHKQHYNEEIVKKLHDTHIKIQKGKLGAQMIS